MRHILITLLVSGTLLSTSPFANGQEPATDATSVGPFLQANSWWNLYFARDNNPLRRADVSVNAVKVLETDPRRPSWIKVAFPKSREDHMSIFGPVAEARENNELTVSDAIIDWEKTISNWEVMWVNLDFVVRATPVGLDHSAAR